MLRESKGRLKTRSKNRKDEDCAAFAHSAGVEKYAIEDVKAAGEDDAEKALAEDEDKDGGREILMDVQGYAMDVKCEGYNPPEFYGCEGYNHLEFYDR